MRVYVLVALVAFLSGLLVGQLKNPMEHQESDFQSKQTAPGVTPEKSDKPETQTAIQPNNTPNPEKDSSLETNVRTEARVQSRAHTSAAEQSLELAIEKQNLEAIWQLAFDLIANGRYDEVDRLYEKFADAFHGGNLDSPLWKSPDFYTGNLMREYADNEIAFLGYLGHLAQLKQPGELLADLRLELLEGEAAPLILGFHEGRNPEVVASWLPYYQDRIENWTSTSFRNREIILALGNIPVEESAFLLMEILPWAGSSQKLDVVRALARNGTAPAIETLINISRDDANPVLRRAASEAIKLLR